MSPQAYVIASRRSAVGRVGGLHHRRPLQELAGPVLRRALEAAKLNCEDVDEVLVGNTLAGSNPARLISLSCGLPMATPALTLDGEGASGLDAIVQAVRAVTSGDAKVVVAGGAESVSRAPWRISKPKSLYGMPRFQGQEASEGHAGDGHGDPRLAAADAWAQRLQVDRSAQDAWALRSHTLAEQARDGRRFLHEIVPLKAAPSEARDESAIAPDLRDIANARALHCDSGTLSGANTSSLHDGAAFVVVVSHAVWTQLGEPAALRVQATARVGVAGEDAMFPSQAALLAVASKAGGPATLASLTALELGESSSVEALALISGLKLDAGIMNAQGGEIVRGHVPGASGAILVARLMTRLLGDERARSGSRLGAVALGTSSGLGVAALLEAVGGT